MLVQSCQTVNTVEPQSETVWESRRLAVHSIKQSSGKEHMIIVKALKIYFFLNDATEKYSVKTDGNEH